MMYPHQIKISIETLKEVSSTNHYLAQLCKESKAKEFHTVWAEYQTAGKGQRGNSWESENGKNLTFSTVLYPTSLKAKDQFYLSMIVAFATVDALGDYTDGFSIKWPNDIYWKDQKIGGILIENELEGAYITQSIIGIGINVNQEEFRSQAPNPVSLFQIIGATIERKELFYKILHGIMGGYILLETKQVKATSVIHSLYLKNLYRKNGFHLYRDSQGEFKAEFHQIEPNGCLVLKDEEGILRRYAFKEVSFILP